MERIRATYLIETPLSIETAAKSLAGEQSSGTFVSVPGETEQLKDRYGARLEQVEELEVVPVPSLPGAKKGVDGYRRARVVISWLTENTGQNLPVLISTVQGNMYELPQLSGVRLLDLDFPPEFVSSFRGPAFGVKGTRELVGVQDRPILGTIIKPSIGLSPAETAEIVKILAEAGIDFIKDDELMANPPHSPLRERVKMVMQVINDMADRTGKKTMYAFNITDNIDAMQRHYDTILEHRGTCAMVSLNSVGMAGVKRIADRGELPIHGHRNGWGMLTRCPMLGMDFSAYQKLWRMAGIDQLHVNGIQNKFWESDDSVVASMKACVQLHFSQRKLLPVVSSGQWGGQAFETYRRTRTMDLMYLAGGGILGHPDGPVCGVQALREAWEGAADGQTFAQTLTKSAALSRAAERFGKYN